MGRTLPAVVVLTLPRHGSCSHRSSSSSSSSSSSRRKHSKRSTHQLATVIKMSVQMGPPRPCTPACFICSAYCGARSQSHFIPALRWQLGKVCVNLHAGAHCACCRLCNAAARDAFLQSLRYDTSLQKKHQQAGAAFEGLWNSRLPSGSASQATKHSTDCSWKQLPQIAGFE